ncbi:MAG TPA: hypothetical protein VNT79_16020 [Phycisphaerae bacterium]|nr:hypothetical protein [Phycisphaerae bacterium]
MPHFRLITHRCPKGHCRAPVRTRVDRAGRLDAVCPRCNEPLWLQIPEEMANDRLVNQCACCPGREFFIRKDFPQKLGFALVVIFGLAASIAYYYERVLVTFAILGALVVIDALIYLFVGKVTVCYRCRAEYRGFAYNPAHEGFDLATSEKYG